MSLWSFEGAVVSAFPSQFPVVIAAGVHLFPFRTEQLSPPAPMVLGGQPPGRVGRRRLLWKGRRKAAFLRLHAPLPSLAWRSEAKACACGRSKPTLRLQSRAGSTIPT